MPVYAIDDIDDAIAATRALLTPVDRLTWLKLALVTVFVGGPGAGFGNQFDAPVNVGGPESLPGGVPALDTAVPPGALPVIGAVVLVVLLLALAFMLVGAVMEFVFVESLRREEVRVRAYWAERWRQGLRLFGFRLALGLVGLAAFAAAALGTLGPALLGGAGFSAVAAFLLLPAIVALAAAFGLVNGFTTVFVVPTMVAADVGVLAGWRRFWSALAAEPIQYLAYAVAGFVLSVAGGIVLAVGVLVAALVLLVPFGIASALGFGLFLAAEPLGIAALAAVGLAYLLAVVVAAALVGVPVKTFLRYYALLVLGDTDADLDLIPERREAVRDSG